MLPLAASLLLLANAGCDQQGVKVYKTDAGDGAVPVPPPAIASGAMPSSMPEGLPAPDNSGLPQVKYSLPAGWSEKKLTQMRVASFAVVEGDKQADVSVIPMGGLAGGNVANVNRWRGQVGLAETDEAAVAKLAEKVSVAGAEADLFDISGTVPGSGDAQRILATALHKDETTWFFKMTGDSALVEKNKPAFVAFLKSVAFGDQPGVFTTESVQLPPSHPPIAGLERPNASAAADSGKPTWTIPAGWQEGALTQFLIAKYVITGSGDTRAEVNVSSLNGDGGGLLANINRWRGQLGLAVVAAADVANLPTVDASGGKATVVEFAGTNPRTGKAAQLVGLVLPLGGQTWFYKLMGDAEVVAVQKAALIQFVQSAKYPAN